MVDKTGANTDPKVTGDVLGEAGVGVSRQQHHARLRPLVHPQTSKALLKLLQISLRNHNLLYCLYPQMFIRKLGAELFFHKNCVEAEMERMRKKCKNYFNVINKICFFNTSTVSARRLIRADCAAELKAAQFVFLQSHAALICADQSGLAIAQLRPITRLICISYSQSQNLKLPRNHEQNQS